MSNLDQNGLSIGGFNFGTVSAQRPIVPQGSRPADKIAAAANTMHKVGTLQYPPDMPKYYMEMAIMKYNRTNLFTVGTGETITTVFLPYPDAMIDQTQVAYEHAKFSDTLGMATNAGFGAAKNLVNNFQNQTGQQGVNQLIGDAAGVLGDAGKGFIGDAIGSSAQGAALAGAVGYTPNYFLTVILQGPQYKTYNLSWTFAPRTPQESLNLRQIIRVFQDAMAPGTSLGGALFNFPRVFQNSYQPNPGMLYQYKPSVLMNFAVNYTPGGSPSMKQADSAMNGWNAPTAMKISAQFQELEFWLRGEYGDVNGTGAQGVSNRAIPPTYTGDTT